MNKSLLAYRLLLIFQIAVITALPVDGDTYQLGIHLNAKGHHWHPTASSAFQQMLQCCTLSSFLVEWTFSYWQLKLILNVKWIYLKFSWENFNCTERISGLKFFNSNLYHQIKLPFKYLALIFHGGSIDIKWHYLRNVVFMWKFGLILNRILRETEIKDLPWGTFRHMAALKYL